LFVFFSAQSDIIIGSNKTDYFQHIWWSTFGHAAVVIAQNDIYFIPDITKSQTSSHRVTYDGKANTVYNGITDRLYEGKTYYVYLHK